jgi:hypothetical protein
LPVGLVELFSGVSFEEREHGMGLRITVSC